jgi:Tol biopolymer transport system component
MARLPPLLLLLLAAVLLIPAAADATAPPGVNGDIAFTSGRAPQNNDANARIWIFKYPNGPATQVTTVPDNTQHRQPNLSPDHTKLAYAAKDGAGNTSIWIKDLVTGSSTEFIPAAMPQDKPSWSPDGTKIAYGQVGNIYVKDISPGSTAQLISNSGTDERPVWSPDGNTIYFNRGAVGSKDIIKKSPVALSGTETPLVTTAGGDDWQAAVSPDGSRLCYTRGPQSSGADVYTASAITPNTDVAPFAATAGVGDENCVWSPDGTKIAYTQGAFGAGDLVEKRVDGSGFRVLTADASPSVYFDGNADWAANFGPRCPGGSFHVTQNTSVSVPLSCTDPESDQIARSIVSQPGHGALGPIQGNATTTYTPATNFVGSDRFTFKGKDGATESSPGTIALTVDRDTQAATVDQVSVVPATWRRGPALPAVLARRAKVGTTISFRLSERARATLTFSRRARGRKVGRRCRKPTRRNRRARRCTRFVKAGTLSVNGPAGANRVRFGGRLSRRKRLGLGRYRLTILTRDLAGNLSKRTKPVRFRIVRR